MKLLILTSEYPNPNSTFDTPVVHYYAKDWIELGHEVRVVHFRSVFPSFFYFFSKTMKTLLKKIFQTDFVPVERLNKRVEFVHEGINVISQPIFKIFPHFKFFNSTIRKQAEIIYTDNLDKNFQPDIIISHFFNPQLPLVTELKEYYPNAKTSLVLHENPKVISDLFGSSSKKLLNNLDYIGFRFNEMRNVFFSLFGKGYSTFICPSGIPENYILSGGKKDFSDYYTANYDSARFDSSLKEKMILSTHNLVSDSSFNSFQLIVCRNVLIYFDKPLQERVFKLFDDSLENLGYLALGSKETLRFSNLATIYQQIDDQKIWKKTTQN
jgi:hypothetical protein